MKKVLVVTGTRAEYGLLFWTIKALSTSSNFDLCLCVTGMHLSPEFGLTYKMIEDDGFKIHEKVEMLMSSDTSVGISKSVGLGIISFSEVYERVKPDLILVLGDRFEIFAAVSAAMIARIPVAHCHGGESTEGLIDEPIRHSITKMAHIHFAATEKYKNRIIQLGENPKYVYNVGGLGIENINRLNLLSKHDLELSLNFKFSSLNFLITFHPVTLEKFSASIQFSNLLAVLNQYPSANLIFTKSNSDTDGRIINNMIDEFVSENKNRAISFFSMGQIRYLSTLQYVDLVIGNSSSGLLEVPSFNIPTIDIGDRQKGRIKAESVISCNEGIKEIKAAFELGLSNSFIEKCNSVKNPYDQGNSSEHILTVLKNLKFENLIKKTFFDFESL